MFVKIVYHGCRILSIAVSIKNIVDMTKIRYNTRMYAVHAVASESG